MSKKLKNIKILVWDVDGTLYQSDPEVSQRIKKAFWQRLAQIKGVSLKEAKKIFEKEKKRWRSSTLTLEKLGCGGVVEILQEIETKVDKASFLSLDPKLVKTFKSLSRFRHLALSNSLEKTTERTLKTLGVRSFFEKIISVEERGSVKPSLSSFKKVLSYTGILSQLHLAIGDREELDLVPAKKLGMKTCLVWQKSDHPSVDISIARVYDIVKILK